LGLIGGPRGAVGLVGIAELLEGVAEASGSVAGATFGIIIAAIGQVVLLSRHLVWERWVRKKKAGRPMDA
jgi:hypothetical protein